MVLFDLLHHTAFSSYRVFRAEPLRPDPPAEMLLAGDPDAGPDLEVSGPSWETHLLP